MATTDTVTAFTVINVSVTALYRLFYPLTKYTYIVVSVYTWPVEPFWKFLTYHRIFIEIYITMLIHVLILITSLDSVSILKRYQMQESH